MNGYLGTKNGGKEMNDIKIKCGPPLIRLDLILPDVADPVIIYIKEEHKNKFIKDIKNLSNTPHFWSDIYSTLYKRGWVSAELLDEENIIINTED